MTQINHKQEKTSDTSRIVQKTDCNAKITEVEGKIASISDLAVTSALIAVENKIIYLMFVIQLKTDHNTKNTEIEKKVAHHNHDKYITTPEFNKLSAEVFKARLKQANLVTKTDFDD